MQAACYSCWFTLQVPFLTVGQGSYFGWLPLQYRGGLTAVCVPAVSPQVAHCVKCLLFSSIQLQLHLEEVFRKTWLGVVKK
jgi:hypothetical protein